MFVVWEIGAGWLAADSGAETKSQILGSWAKVDIDGFYSESCIV
jgi:hypothetical protein